MKEELMTEVLNKVYLREMTIADGVYKLLGSPLNGTSVSSNGTKPQECSVKKTYVRCTCEKPERKVIGNKKIGAVSIDCQKCNRPIKAGIECEHNWQFWGVSSKTYSHHNDDGIEQYMPTVENYRGCKKCGIKESC